MATKIKTMKLLQEWHGVPHSGQRQPPQKPSALLMQLRCHATQPRPPRRRIPIRIDKNEVDFPTPVKIIFL